MFFEVSNSLTCSYMTTTNFNAYKDLECHLVRKYIEEKLFYPWMYSDMQRCAKAELILFGTGRTHSSAHRLFSELD